MDKENKVYLKVLIKSDGVNEVSRFGIERDVV
jgi:hypothetical protein